MPPGLPSRAELKVALQEHQIERLRDTYKDLSADPTWTDLIDDATYRQIFELVAQHQIVNEVEAEKMLGSARRVRAFSRAVDALAARLPFEVEIVTVSGLKAWKRRA